MISQPELPFFASRKILSPGLLDMYFLRRGIITKLTSDFIPHLGSPYLEPTSPLYLLSVSNAASSRTSVPTPSKDMVTLSFELCCPRSSGSFTYSWNYLAFSLTRTFQPLLPSVHFAYMYYAWHITDNTYLFSELNLSWCLADRDLGSVRTPSGGRLLAEEFLYTDYFTLLPKRAVQTLLKSSSQRTEAEAMMNLAS